MVVKANIVKNKTIGVDLNQKAGGFNAPVQSVNSKTGDVVLNANDVGADPEGTAEEKVAEHNTDTEAHNDIRVLVQDLTEAIPDWAKQPTKPTYTYNEVGADEAGTAVATVNAHNESETAHNDIRTLIQGLSERLNAVANSTDTDLDQLAELVAYIKANRGLIEGVTTNKVNVSDIINNLTTNVSNKPLSAAQGVALKSLIDALSEWTHQAVDEIVEFVSKDSNIGSAFNLVSSNTLNWNGDTAGKLIAVNGEDPSMSYVRVSSVVPTLAELQNGGSYATTGADGIEYEEPFTSGMIVDSDTIINCFDGYVLVAKEDNVQFVDEYTDCTFAKAGIYFAYFGAEGYTSKLAITDYTGFVKPVLKMESLTPHRHDWYGKPINKGNTARGDDTIHGGYVKVSDAVPTESELRNGGIVRHFNVENNEITGDLIINDYLGSDYSFIVRNEGITISYGVMTLVVISFNGSPSIGGVTFSGVDSPGVYFYQSEYGCTHSLTINGYEGFNYNFEKIPVELIPEGVGGGVLSWNDLMDKPFEETTVMGDTLTWDGNTEGLYSFMDMFFCVSDVVPTLEELQQGGSVVVSDRTVVFDENSVVDMGTGFILVADTILIATTPNADFQGVIAEKAGIYFPSPENALITAFTINSYTGFEVTVITPIDRKFLPENDMIIQITTEDINANTCEVDKTFDEILNAHNNGWRCIILVNNKILAQVCSASSDDILFVGYGRSQGTSNITGYVYHLFKTGSHECYNFSFNLV